MQNQHQPEVPSAVGKTTREDFTVRHRRIIADFPSALGAADQLSLVYQPQVDLRTGRWVGVEALLRWHHPVLGTISPAEFVPVIERTQLAKPMMEWVAQAALRQTTAWRAKGIKLYMSINASAINLDEPDFAERLLDAMAALNVDPTEVKLEFTEHALANPVQVTRQIEILRDHGVIIAIDDFGTGYSNLSYLMQLPISVLKIDQSFIRNLDTSTKDEKLVRALLGLARGLGYTVVAEGIENRETFEMLREWGCDEGQGYYMSRPVTADVIASALADAKAA